MILYHKNIEIEKINDVRIERLFFFPSSEFAIRNLVKDLPTSEAAISHHEVLGQGNGINIFCVYNSFPGHARSP